MKRSGPSPLLTKFDFLELAQMPFEVARAVMQLYMRCACAIAITASAKSCGSTAPFHEMAMRQTTNENDEYESSPQNV